MMRKKIVCVFDTDAEATAAIQRTREALFTKSVYLGNKLRRRDDFLSALHEALPTMHGLKPTWDPQDVSVICQGLRDVTTTYMKLLMASTDGGRRQRYADRVNECHALMPLWEPEP